MVDREIYYRGTVEFSHHCQAGWRSHTSTVIVQQISPRMGVIVQSDGGGQYRRSNRQWYPVARVAEEEVGKTVLLSRVISNADTAATDTKCSTKSRKRSTLTLSVSSLSSEHRTAPQLCGFQAIRVFYPRQSRHSYDGSYTKSERRYKL